jgi:hypothetical protein
LLSPELLSLIGLAFLSTPRIDRPFCTCRHVSISLLSLDHIGKRPALRSVRTPLTKRSSSASSAIKPPTQAFAACFNALALWIATFGQASQKHGPWLVL